MPFKDEAGYEWLQHRITAGDRTFLTAKDQFCPKFSTLQENGFAWGLEMFLDVPWHHVPLSPFAADGGVEPFRVLCLCPSGGGHVTPWISSGQEINAALMRGHVSLDLNQHDWPGVGEPHTVWVGQCTRCKTIYWSYPAPVDHERIGGKRNV